MFTNQEEMNIAEILKNAPKGTKLYSPIFGDATLLSVDKKSINVMARELSCWVFSPEGKLSSSRPPENGECLLFPSKENRDWTTFKVESQYPNTYALCCKALNIDINDNERGYGHKSMLLVNLQQLLVCRDAWWKLDDYWEPNWADSDTDKWVIENYDEDIHVDAYTNTNFILAFRTEEIANKFLETFHNLIESCQELI